MSVLSQPDTRDWSALPPADLDWSVGGSTVEGLRVGLLLDAGCGMPCQPDVRSVVGAAAAEFEAGGAAVEPMVPWLGPSMLADVDLFWRVRSLVDFWRLPQHRRDLVLPYLASWVMGGEGASGTRVLEAYQSIMAMRAATVAETTAYDLVLSPVAPIPAFPAHWPMPWGEDSGVAMAHIGFTVPFSMSGQPACSVPAGRLADGRTVGLQVAGRRFDDIGVLRAAAWFEAASGAGSS
jgi:aspartyl-tRNA(Asn)/glutamyl-tRNA(Gln) amidotransferase subunit A